MKGSKERSWYLIAIAILIVAVLVLAVMLVTKDSGEKDQEDADVSETEKPEITDMIPESFELNRETIKNLKNSEDTDIEPAELSTAALQLCTGGFSDDFAGNGTLSSNWLNKTTAAGTNAFYQRVNGEMRLAATSTLSSTFGHAVIALNRAVDTYTGDVRATMVFKSLTTSSSENLINTQYIEFFPVTGPQYDNDAGFYINYDKTSNSYLFYAFSFIGGTGYSGQSTILPVTAGDITVTIERQGNVYLMYYQTASIPKTQLGNLPAYMGDVYFGAEYYSLGGASQFNVTATLDTFAISCPAGAEPWTGWTKITDSTRYVSMATVTGGSGSDKLFQARRGNDGLVYTRYYDAVTTTWSSWVASGGTPGTIGMGAVGDKVFQTVRGYENWMWTRIYDNDTGVWSSWVPSGGTLNNITNATIGNLMFQSVRGAEDGWVWTRIWDNTAEAWTTDWAPLGATPGDIAMAPVGSSTMIQAVRGNENWLWSRAYNISTKTWSNWVANGGTKENVTMEGHSNTTFQALRGAEDGLTYTRIYDGGANAWTNWSSSLGTNSEIGLGSNVSAAKVFESIIGSGSNVSTRTYSGLNASGSWGAWKYTIKANPAHKPTFGTIGNTTFQVVVDSSNQMWMRKYN